MSDIGLRDEIRNYAAAAPPSGATAAAFIMRELEALASPDPELRDSLFYELADSWIRSGLLRPADMAALLDRLLSRDFLFRDIGAKTGISVYRRSFSILLVDSLLSSKAVAGLFALRPRGGIQTAVIDYARLEADLRGFSREGGWAHTAAHTADALATLMALPSTPAEEEALLGAAAFLVEKNDEVYTHNEDRRISRILQALYAREGPEAPRILALVDGLIERQGPCFDDAVRMARRVNVLNLLRAFFFQVRAEDGARGREGRLAGELEARIGAMMRIRILL